MPVVNIPPGHPLRDRRWRPENPTCASEGTIAAVRQALWKLDPRLDVWWYRWHRSDTPEHGRWAIMYWKERAQEWSVVFFWEGPGGEYRQLSLECTQPILNCLAECEEEADVASRRAAEEKRVANAKDHEEVRQASAEYTRDFLQRDQGIRQTFAPGYIRRRSVKPADIENTNHKLWLRSRDIELP